MTTPDGGNMPHVIVKLWPGKTNGQKRQFAGEITQSVTRTLNYGDESVSVAFEEIDAGDWPEKVYRKDIVGNEANLYKKPGYSM
jgi:4-oxalocrotonate tautomerase